MSFSASRRTVDDTATALTSSGGFTDRHSMVIRNRGSVSVDLGGADVVSGSGFELGAGESLVGAVASPDVLYAVAASGQSARLDVLEGT